MLTTTESQDDVEFDTLEEREEVSVLSQAKGLGDGQTAPGAADVLRATAISDDYPFDSSQVDDDDDPLSDNPEDAVRDAKVNRMGTASIPKLLLEFSIPAIIGSVVNGIYNIIDSIFLGQAVGEIGLAAATVANPIMTVFGALGVLVGVGGNALAAIRLGEKRRHDAEIVLGNTLVLGLFFGLLCIILTSIPPLLDWLLTISSATDEVRPYARTFVRIIGSGVVFQVIGFGINNFIRTAGAPNRAMVTMLVGAISCVVLNYLFVMVLGWGVLGSALATVGGQAIMCFSVLWYFTLTKNVPLRLHLRFMRPQPRIMGKILALGSAGFIMQVGGAVVNFFLNNALVTYGALSAIGADDALAAIGVVSRITIFAFLPIMGISTAAQPLLGFNYGARNIPRVLGSLKWAVIFASVVCVIGWALLMLFAQPAVALFGITHEGLQEYTMYALRVSIAVFPLVGFQVVCSNYFQATGQPVKSIILGMTRQIMFFIPLLFVLPKMWPMWFPGTDGLDGLFFAYPASDLMAFTTVVIFILFELRRLKRIESGEVAVRV